MAYLPAQVAGCAGAVLANLMFHGPAVSFSTRDRMTGPHFVAEIVATAGLVPIIFALARTGRSRHAPAVVGPYIGAAYFIVGSRLRRCSSSSAPLCPGAAVLSR